MLVWLSMLIAVILLWAVIPEAMGKKKKRLTFLFISGLLVAFLVGSRCPFRSGSGDLYVYYNVYLRTAAEPIDDIIKHYTMERSYLEINRFLASIFPWGQFIIYFEAFFTTFSVFRFIYKNTEDVFTGVIVYICTGGWGFFLTGFRQAFAISICLFAFEYMKKKKFQSDLMALLLIFIASLFHTTTWIFAAAFLLRSIKINRYKVMTAIIVTAVAFVVMNPFVDALEKVMGSSYRVGYDGNIFGGLVPIAFFLGALLLSYLAWIQDKSYLEKYSFQINMLIFGLCLYLFRYNTMVFERISYYFTIVVSALLPNALNAINDPRTKTVAKAVCVIMCLVLFIYRWASSDYYFYWENMIYE